MRTMLAMIAVLVLATVAQAAVVNLSITGGGGTWEVRAAVVGGGEGICDFGVSVVGSGGLTVASSLNASPQGVDSAPAPAYVKTWGFCDMRTDGTAGIGIVASQKAIYAGVNDPAQDALVLQNIGQLAGSRTGTISGPISWDANVVLATGTYTGDVGTLTVTGAGWTLLKTVGSWRGPGNLAFPEEINPGSVYIPEPATMVLLGLGGIGVLLRRRRA